jgi:hypothetical protein
MASQPASLEKHPERKEQARFAVASPWKTPVCAVATTDWPEGQCNALA